ncbi:MAG: aminoglycoside phosphotransferase family protein, partial [Candidatus Poribacteria bacterium]|nr:aminoglycoside phosphotransferase family protein [Candidatus Poribacteria bacterium]
YFRHPDDVFDRLDHEFAFCSAAWEAGVRATPQPFVADETRGAALYEFIDGRRLAQNEIGEAEVALAMMFYRALNAPEMRRLAERLSPGREACFCLSEHLATVERRLLALKSGIAHDTTVAETASRFVREELSPAWETIAERARCSVGMDASLDASERCLSPSDFGFHNALRLADGSLRFVDFEYAGWDDPAKLVCDFLCQPAIPVPSARYGQVADAVATSTVDRERFDALLPVYRLKWCCIMMNEFLPVGDARRRFAGQETEREQRRATQLDKARDYLRKALSADDGIH